MTPREELDALRRLAELESKARGVAPQQTDDPMLNANPTDGMSGVQRFGAGMGKAFVDLGRGAGQLVGAVPQEDIDEAKRIDAPLMRTGAGMAGNIIGNVAALAPAAIVPGANTILGGAALGGLSGLTQPVASDESRLMNTAAGTVAGGALPGLIRGAQVAKSAVEPFYEGGRNQILSRAMQRAGGADAPQVQQRLANAQELVPGSSPTAGEISGNANIAAMQRAAAQADPEAYAARAIQQNEARVAALRDLAGTGGQREFHATARETTAKQLYDEAYVAGADIRRDPITGHFRSKAEISGIKGEVTKLMKRPAMKKAVEQARILAANEGNTKLHPFTTVKGMDYTKRAIDDMIEKASGNEARILKAMKDRLLTTADRLSPKYAKARTTFRDMSRPINQMDIAEEVSNKSINPLTGKLEPAAYARALNDDTAARATGYNRATLANTLEPEQAAKLEAIKADLARSVEARDLGRGPGSNTFQNFAMGNMLEQSGVPSFVRGMTLPQIAGGITGRIGNAAYGDADKLMRERLAQALLNPREAAQLMNATKQLSPKQRRMIEALRSTSVALPVGAVQAKE